MRHDHQASTTQDFSRLLELAGARLRGSHRADCPCCHGFRTVSFDEVKGLFNCHNAKDGKACEFHGTRRTLERQLGLARKLSPPEVLELRRLRRHDQQMREGNGAMRRHGHELLELVRKQIRLATDQGPTRHSWNVLDQAYRKESHIERVLEQIEQSPYAQFRRWDR